MLRTPNHPEFCHHHAQQQLRALDRTPVEPLAAEILGPVREFRTAAAINAALGNIFVQLADGRLDPRRAAVLTYIAQGMFQTLKRVGWEQIERNPSPELQTALSAILKARMPGEEAARTAQDMPGSAADSGDPGPSS
jgi:hypothetical protein